MDCRPQPGKLSTYTDAMDRLNANFAFAADRMPKDAVCPQRNNFRVHALIAFAGTSGGDGCQETNPIIYQACCRRLIRKPILFS